jgi:hypothetical protein
MKLPQQAQPVMRNSAHLARLLYVNNGVVTSDACVSVTIKNGKACLNVPVVGNVCVSVPSWVPNGDLAQACVDICKTWGIPTGACVKVDVAGQQVAKECFGKC